MLLSYLTLYINRIAKWFIILYFLSPQPKPGVSSVRLHSVGNLRD